MNRGLYMVLSSRDLVEQFASGDERRRILFYRDGINSSVAVTANVRTGALALRLSGKPVADTTTAGRPHLVFLGQIPLLFAPDARRVAVIGLGVGVTTGSVLSHDSVESVDVIDLESTIVEAGKYFAHTTDYALSDPRTRVVIEDGRTFLTYAGQSYDVITTDAVAPIVAGAANLYTRDFYEIARRSLSEGGIFCQWIDTWTPSESTYWGILATIRAVFPHVAVFTGGVVMASEQPIRIPWETFEAGFAKPRVRQSFEVLGINTPAQLLSHFLAGDEQVARYVGDDTRLITDDDNWLERQLPTDLRRRDRPSLDMLLLERFEGRRVEALLDMLPGLPLQEVAHLFAQPGRAFLGQPNELLAKEFLAFYRRQGAAEQVQQMLAWQREGPGEAPMTNEAYVRLVRSARRAQREQQAEAVNLYLEILHYTNGANYYEAGMALAQIHAREGRHEEALHYTRLMRLRSPALAPAYIVEIQILRALGRPELAQRVAEQARLFQIENPQLERLLQQGAASAEGA
jgi:tetratricopeptide (TPR) repeat protein